MKYPAMRGGAPVAHDVHGLIQFYDVNFHSQNSNATDDELHDCGCPTGVNDSVCYWRKFFDIITVNPGDYRTPYTPDLFTIQEVGTVPGKHHVDGDVVESYLNSLPGQTGAYWGHMCTDATGACAVFWRNDSNGFMYEDSMQFPLLDTPNFIVQAVKLGTRNGDRHIGVASVHTNPDPLHAHPGHARNHAFNQMQMAWGDIHLIIAGDFNATDVPDQEPVPEVVGVPFDGWTKPNHCDTGERIDYVFMYKMTASSGSQAGNELVVPLVGPKRFYSDHRGLGVTLYWSDNQDESSDEESFLNEAVQLPNG